ncbi:MAG: OmpA family protein [Bacteroidales bacterium]|nr:OmpA family protein [Bacteroidales bacterium]
MKRLIVLALATLFLSFAANAQIGNLIRNKLNQKVEEGVNNAIDKAVDNAVDKTFENTQKAIEKEKNDNSKTVHDDAHDNGGWTCPACGAKGNTGNFCKECAAKKPGASSATETNTASESGWTCPACGHTGNQGKFCNECGAKKPEATAADDSWTCPQCGHKGNKGKFCDECGAKRDGTKQNERAQSEWNKFDFVPGDEVIFYDQLEGEQLGEFPSKWELIDGECEIQRSNGENVIALMPHCNIMPLMKTTWNYLPEVYTVEFDYYDFVENEGEDFGDLHLSFYANPEGKNDRGGWLWGFTFDNFVENYTLKDQNFYKDFHTTVWATTTDKGVDNTNRIERVEPNKWHHISVSVNKRAIKVYFDQTRVFNLPNYKNPNGGHIEFTYDFCRTPAYIRNVRIAKGAVPLYDRMMTDGKFITYGITFDVGKSVIKPESMGEINRIVQLMNDNPELKFEVQGHTDNTGNAASNQTLSEARAKAIVDKLVEMGISADRLTSVGKGQTSPIADNSTEEGKAKNRRVEFVKK